MSHQYNPKHLWWDRIIITVGEFIWGMKPQMWCTKKYFFNNLFYSKLFWKGKGNLTLSLFILMSNYRCIFIVPVVQWIGLVYFLCYVHSSIKVILGHKRWCIILWIPFFIGPDFKIRSLPFVREHWRHETEKVCVFHVKMNSCASQIAYGFRHVMNFAQEFEEFPATGFVLLVTTWVMVLGCYRQMIFRCLVNIIAMEKVHLKPWIKVWDNEVYLMVRCVVTNVSQVVNASSCWESIIQL